MELYGETIYSPENIEFVSPVAFYSGRWVNALILMDLETSIGSVKISIANTTNVEELITLGYRLINLVNKLLYIELLFFKLQNMELLLLWMNGLHPGYEINISN